MHHLHFYKKLTFLRPHRLFISRLNCSTVPALSFQEAGRAAQWAPTNQDFAGVAVAKTGLQAVLLGEPFTLGSANCVSSSAHLFLVHLFQGDFFFFFFARGGLVHCTCTLHESSILRSFIWFAMALAWLNKAIFVYRSLVSYILDKTWWCPVFQCLALNVFHLFNV